MEPAAHVPRPTCCTCVRKNKPALAGWRWHATRAAPSNQSPSPLSIYISIALWGMGGVVMWIKLGNPISYTFQPRQSVRMKCRSQALGKFHAVLFGPTVAPVSFACQCAKAAWGMKSLAGRHRRCYFQALHPSRLVRQAVYWKDTGEKNLLPAKLFFLPLQFNLLSRLSLWRSIGGKTEQRRGFSMQS